MAAILTLHPDLQAPPTQGSVLSAAAPRATAEVYRRRRLAVAALVLGLVAGLASMGHQADASRTPEAAAADSVTYVVQPGDTLWSIANMLSPGGDPRPLVHELDAIAGGALLQPGQLLIFPGHLVD